MPPAAKPSTARPRTAKAPVAKAPVAKRRRAKPSRAKALGIAELKIRLVRSLNQMNGWLRLWFMFSIVCGIIFAAFTINSLPNSRDIQKAWAQEVMQILASDMSKTLSKEVSPVELKLIDSFRGKSDEEITREWTTAAKNINLDDPRQKSLTAYKANVLNIEQRYQEKLDNLFKEQLEYVLIALLEWIAASIAVLALGYSAAWIVRGFKPGAGPLNSKS